MTIARFIPAVYQYAYETEHAAIRATSLDITKMIDQPIPLLGGARVYVINDAAVVIQPLQPQGFELWCSGVGLTCDTREDAEMAVEEFEAIQGTGGWRIFERLD